MLKCKPICDELGKECSFSQPTPGSLSSTTTTSADEKFEALLNIYFRQVDVVCVCRNRAAVFFFFSFRKKKKEAAMGIRLIDSECTMCIVMALAGQRNSCVYAQLETFMSWPTHLSRDWLSSLPRPFSIRKTKFPSSYFFYISVCHKIQERIYLFSRKIKVSTSYRITFFFF